MSNFFQMSEYAFMDPIERAKLDSKWAQSSVERRTNVRNVRTDAETDQTKDE
jgi:hypothetical protein